MPVLARLLPLLTARKEPMLYYILDAALEGHARAVALVRG